MIVELSRHHIPELPALGHGVQASCNHIEVARGIVARTGVPLGGSSTLKVQPDRSIGHPLSEDVLAFDPERPAPLEAEFDVGCPFFVEIPAVSDARNSREVSPEMMLGHPSADGHLQSARSGDEVEYFLREFELAGKRVQGRRGRDRDQVGIGIGGDRYGRRSKLLGQEMAMPLVLAARVALQSEVAQQRFGRAADQDLDRLVLAGSAVALPNVPSLGPDRLDGCVLELDGDEKLGRVVEHRIRRRRSRDWIPHEEGGVKPVRILPKRMQAPVLSRT
jgi:hypothetical protein